MPLDLGVVGLGVVSVEDDLLDAERHAGQNGENQKKKADLAADPPPGGGHTRSVRSDDPRSVFLFGLDRLQCRLRGFSLAAAHGVSLFSIKSRIRPVARERSKRACASSARAAIRSAVAPA